MQLLAFCFYDSKAQYFSTPFFCHHRGQALRMAIDLTSDPGTHMGRYPEDFHLYELGYFDDATGSLYKVEPMSMGPCSSFIKPRPGTNDPVKGE